MFGMNLSFIRFTDFCFKKCSYLNVGDEMIFSVLLNDVWCFKNKMRWFSPSDPSR